MMTRTLIDELLSVMKLKTSLPDSTLILVVHLILQVNYFHYFCLFLAIFKTLLIIICLSFY